MIQNLKFKYILTTRGPNPKGRINSLESLPESFWPLVHVATGKEHRKSLQATYPGLKFLATPPEVNTASLKRTWLFNNHPKTRIVLINDEITIYTVTLDKKTVRAKLDEASFYRHLLVLESLADRYVGFSAHPKLFSNYMVEEGKLLKDRCFIGAFFHYNPKFALQLLKLGRLNYHEDIDYTLQTLSMGYKTAAYAGILFAAPTTVPTRQFNDRTVKVQDRDTKLILKYFPDFVSLKKEYDPLKQNLNIDIKFVKAYTPKARVLFICHGNINRSAAAQLYAERKFKAYDFKSAGVKDNAGGELTTKRMRGALSNIGIETEGIRSSKLSTKLINWADIIYYMDGGNLKRIHASFPKLQLEGKLKSLASVIGKTRIDDPAFSGVESFPRVLLDITTAVDLEFSNGNIPKPVVVNRPKLF